jgi:hypothetical protein
MANQTVPLEPVPGCALWQAELGTKPLPAGVHSLGVEPSDEAGRTTLDAVRVALRSSDASKTELRPGRDLDNVLGAWPERNIPGTQLGPNKNGRKW